MADGDLEPAAYENIENLSAWMKTNGEAIHGTRALQGNETASVPATSKGDVRYLYLVPAKKGEKDEAAGTISITRLTGSYHAQLLGGDTALTVTRDSDTITTGCEGVIDCLQPGFSSSSWRFFLGILGVLAFTSFS